MTAAPVLSIRPATSADWNAIAALLAAANLPLDGAQEHLAHFIVGEHDGRIVAVAGLEVYGDAALLRSVVVDSALRGHGYGDQLQATLAQRAAAQGIHRLILLTTTAAAFFAKRGFRTMTRSDAPSAMQASREFQGACPASATVMQKDLLPVAVLGAGPVGLAAAAHLIERGMTPLIFEAGNTIAANLASYSHVRLFSPWQYNVDRAAKALLEQAGWQPPPADALPTAGELVQQYLQPLAALPAMAAALKLRHRVTAITRQGTDKVKTRGRGHAPFVIRAMTPDGERAFLASAVIDATGTWNQPNPLGADGLPALGEQAAREQVIYGMPDVLGAARARYAGRHVLVVGAGHSAAGTLLALAQLAAQAPQTRIAWAIRGTGFERIFGGGANDGLQARGELGTRLKALKESGRLELHTGLRIQAIEPHQGKLRIIGQAGSAAIDGIDEIIAATGARPDLSLARELRVRHDPWLESTDALAPLIDPNEHSCGTVRPHGHAELAHPEPRYYAVGAKSYGRAPNFLMTTGYEQVRSVVAALAGDVAAADDVQLALPETGVCNTRFVTGEPAGASCGIKPATAVASGCCGGPAPAETDACCALDVAAKAEGQAGCGCA
ncbi:GNAT family N-acetyltransferase [Duganella sp. FT92W]|uniref:GNAT family N-acetyltransferase n=1 Tax=Pseudoduganella rivuli TaxID=2666085 RepID=A0A7X2IPB9_9BURK|nr:arsenic resistance N-acetyltransferase ArsN2 [Pseudoduganella rivuli]MRV73520.1 GNAT family N-acetyltransferase [Pseudoduganella rivuli]